jgi:hypothetical protein
MVKNINFEGSSESQRKVKFILLNIIRFLLVLVILFAFFNKRPLLLSTAVLTILITFIPQLFKLVFKKESAALFDVVLILIILGLLSFWEIQGTYTNSYILAFLMNLGEAIVIGILGFTLVYTYFKYSKLETGNALAVSSFSFCFSFTLGIFLQLITIFVDSIFKFNIQTAGLYGLVGDMVVCFFGSFLVSFGGYLSLKQGKPILVSKFLEDAIAKNPRLFGLKPVSSEDHVEHIKDLIKKGEGRKIEFKSTLRKNLYTNAFDKQIEHSVLKTINAYLNSEGGSLLIGVSDKGEIIGIEADQFLNNDHAQRHLMQLINNHIGAEFLPLIEAKVTDMGGRHIIKIDCKKSDKESFLKSGKDEHFYVRQGSLSTPLTGSALINYVNTNFKNK